MPDISTALALLKKPIEAVANVASGKAKETIGRIRASSNLKTLYQKLNSTQKVKTIWNVDRAIAISSFYYPAKIRTRTNATQPLHKLDDLPSNAVVLSGIVGQGKSILLRHLLGKEIRSGERVPIFVELRRISSLDLAQYVRDTFAQLLETKGIPEVFDLFAKSGRISLLLDGFDEIDPDRTQEIANSIDKLAAEYPCMRIIVTSRPNSGIESSPHFEVIQLAQLSEHDFEGFFHKILPRDRALAENITRAVTQSPTQVKNLASTPLLATLMTIVYRAHQRIPTDLSEFYDELFQILLVRHDRSKSGYERKRKTKLSDRDIQQAFEAFCYKCKAEKLISIPREKAQELASAAISALQLVADEGHFLTDIVKVTCLLQEEGGRYEFLHQSVQEFFASRYIASRPDDVARAFYGLVMSQGQWAAWDHVLRFLAQIDRYRASQYFFIPALAQTLSYLESLGTVASSTKLRTLLSDIVGVVQLLETADGKPSASPTYSVTSATDAQKLFRIHLVQQSMFNTLFGVRGTARDWKKCFDGSTHGQRVSYSTIAANCGAEKALDECLIQFVSNLQSELAEHRARVRLFDESKGFMGL